MQKIGKSERCGRKKLEVKKMLAWAWRTITLKNMKGDTETPVTK